MPLSWPWWHHHDITIDIDQEHLDTIVQFTTNLFDPSPAKVSSESGTLTCKLRFACSLVHSHPLSNNPFPLSPLHLFQSLVFQASNSSPITCTASSLHYHTNRSPAHASHLQLWLPRPGVRRFQAPGPGFRIVSACHTHYLVESCITCDACAHIQTSVDSGMDTRSAYICWNLKVRNHFHILASMG